MVRGIKHAGRLQGRGVAPVQGHAFVFDQYCGIKAGTPTPIDDKAIRNEQIKHRFLLVFL